MRIRARRTSLGVEPVIAWARLIARSWATSPPAKAKPTPTMATNPMIAMTRKDLGIAASLACGGRATKLEPVLV